MSTATIEKSNFIKKSIKETIEKMDIKNKIGVTQWDTDSHENAHITVDPSICNDCPHHLCIAGCPTCLLYTSPSPRDRQKSRMPSSA